MTPVHLSIEARRGCGYRKPSKSGVGIYLMGTTLSRACGRLPVPLEVCPCCGSGIKPTRGWTWITPSQLLTQRQPLDAGATERTCQDVAPKVCRSCPAGQAIPEGRHGLLWVGEKFYRSAEEFLREAAQLGVSRKVSALPREFVLGETWVYLAHRTAVWDPGAKEGRPGIFSAFRPTRVDLVIEDEGAIPDRALALQKKLGDGARLVKVVRAEDAQEELFAS
jgi:hypothetical protein